ncbi:MAG: zinc ribbon domain-containing protein [Sporichthyaceae bacterium]
MAAITERSGRSAVLRDLLVAARTSDSDIGREQTKAEADVDTVRTRSTRDQQRLDAGTVSSAKELESLQHEIASLARRQGDLEDAVLEIMERRESVQTRISELDAENDALGGELQRLQGARDAAFAEIDSEIAEITSQRTMLAGGLPVDLVALYEKLRATSDGVGAAALRRGRCEGCRMELASTELSALRVKAADEITRCEECRRILIRVSDSGL